MFCSLYGTPAVLRVKALSCAPTYLNPPISQFLHHKLLCNYGRSEKRFHHGLFANLTSPEIFVNPLKIYTSVEDLLKKNIQEEVRNLPSNVYHNVSECTKSSPFYLNRSRNSHSSLFTFSIEKVLHWSKNRPRDFDGSPRFEGY